MRLGSLLYFIFTPLLLFSQIDYKENEIYIFSRSTKHKVNFIAEDFNLQDNQITHIGIGYFENDSIKIFNVSNEKRSISNSNLIIENYESFIHLPDILSVSIWSIEVNNIKMKKFKKKLEFYNNSKIIFDENFTLNINSIDNFLYCSEFVHMVLNQIDNRKFHFKPITKKLNAFYSSALKREILKYIPVDFFQMLNFQKRFHFNFNN